MASERSKLDVNRRAGGVVAGVTDNSDLDIVMLRIDPTTKRLKVSATGDVSMEPDGTALTNSQTSVDTTAGGTTIVSASASRQGVVLANHGTVTAYIGTGTVTTSNGFELKGGESVAIPTDSEVKGITSSSSTTIGALILA